MGEQPVNATVASTRELGSNPIRFADYIGPFPGEKSRFHLWRQSRRFHLEAT